MRARGVALTALSPPTSLSVTLTTLSSSCGVLPLRGAHLNGVSLGKEPNRLNSQDTCCVRSGWKGRKPETLWGELKPLRPRG